MTRVAFDSTLDELVDVSMRLVEHTAAYRQQRTRSQWAVGVCVTGGLVVTILQVNVGSTQGLQSFVTVPFALQETGDFFWTPSDTTYGTKRRSEALTRSPTRSNNKLVYAAGIMDVDIRIRRRVVHPRRRVATRPQRRRSCPLEKRVSVSHSARS